MFDPYERCPNCGYNDLDPRKILIGLPQRHPAELKYQEIVTLKCQNCGWLGEQPELQQSFFQ
jgi:hypothetical protein